MPREKRIYLQHDLNARNDPKILELTQAMKGQGKAIWWDLIEMLWEAEGYLPYKPELIAYGLRYCTAKEVERVINDFDLFDHDDEQFWSNGVLSRLGKQRAVSEARAAAARARWDKSPSGDGNPAESPGKAPYRPGENPVIDMMMNKLTEECREKVRTYDGPADDIEEFFAVFHFTKNIRKAGYEVARFIGNYQPGGWCRKGSTQPVIDRRGLALEWKPEFIDDKAYTGRTEGLSYLRDVYDAARVAGMPDRWKLIWEVSGMTTEVASDGTLLIRLRASQAVEAICAKIGLQVTGFKVLFEK